MQFITQPRPDPARARERAQRHTANEWSSPRGRAPPRVERSHDEEGAHGADADGQHGHGDGVEPQVERSSS